MELWDFLETVFKCKNFVAKIFFLGDSSALITFFMI